MELWIRSQDKRKLIKVDEIKMETVKEGNTFIYSHATDLGDYATKERALEVLDEIQKLLSPKSIIGIVDTSTKINDDLVYRPKQEVEITPISNNIIYEMPEE